MTNKILLGIKITALKNRIQIVYLLKFNNVRLEVAAVPVTLENGLRSSGLYVPKS